MEDRNFQNTYHVLFSDVIDMEETGRDICPKLREMYRFALDAYRTGSISRLETVFAISATITCVGEFVKDKEIEDIASLAGELEVPSSLKHSEYEEKWSLLSSLIESLPVE